MTTELNDEDFIEDIQTKFDMHRFSSNDVVGHFSLFPTVLTRLLSLAKKGIKAEKLKEALEFYAAEETYEEFLYGIDGSHPGDVYISPLEKDDSELIKNTDETLRKSAGKRARAALKDYQND